MVDHPGFGFSRALLQAFDPMVRMWTNGTAAFKLLTDAPSLRILSSPSLDRQHSLRALVLLLFRHAVWCISFGMRDSARRNKGTPKRRDLFCG